MSAVLSDPVPDTRSEATAEPVRPEYNPGIFADRPVFRHAAFAEKKTEQPDENEREDFVPAEPVAPAEPVVPAYPRVEESDAGRRVPKFLSHIRRGRN